MSKQSEQAIARIDAVRVMVRQRSLPEGSLTVSWEGENGAAYASTLIKRLSQWGHPIFTRGLDGQHFLV